MTAQTKAQKHYVQASKVMARIHREFTMARDAGCTQANMMELRRNLNKDIERLTVERDRRACRQMMEVILCNFSSYDHTLVYIYEGKSYSVRSGTPDCGTTEYLHSLGLPMAAWDEMEKETRWHHNGNFYCKSMI